MTGAGPKGAWLVYPNYGHKGVAGQRVQFFHYDPDVKDWYVYGFGKVTANAAQIAPDATTRLYQFTGAMINDGTDDPAAAGPTPGTRKKADPVDPSTGVFSLENTDLYVADVLPLALTRTYDSGDNLARAFGRGMITPVCACFSGLPINITEADLILPEGGQIHFVRTSSGTGYSDAVFEHTCDADPLLQVDALCGMAMAGISRCSDGTVYVFGENAPLQAIQDRYGNTVTVTHATGQTGNITQITSPNGRWHRVYLRWQPSDHPGRRQHRPDRCLYVRHQRESLDRDGSRQSQVTTYTYDTVESARHDYGWPKHDTYLTNQYDTNGRVTQQTLADTAAIVSGFSLHR